MDISVIETVLECERTRMDSKVSKDLAMDILYKNWDPFIPDLKSTPDLPAAMKASERCISNYVRTAGKAWGQAVAVEIGVPFGDSKIFIHEILKRGDRTAVIVLFFADPDSTIPETSSDEILAMSDIALQQLKECRSVMLRCEMLYNGTYVENAVNADDIESYRNHPRVRDRDNTPELVAIYAELQEKIDALTGRKEMLLEKQKKIAGELAKKVGNHGEARGNGVTAVVYVRKEVSFPEDKSDIIDILKRKGSYEKLSTVNWSRLRADVAKGAADPEVTKLATIKDTVRIKLVDDQK